VATTAPANHATRAAAPVGSSLIDRRHPVDPCVELIILLRADPERRTERAREGTPCGEGIANLYPSAGLHGTFLDATNDCEVVEHRGFERVGPFDHPVGCLARLVQGE